MKRLLTLAINNYGGYNDLRGCLNDQHDIIEFFKGFEITALTDKEVTVQKTVTELKRLVTLSEPGDTLVIHYSGHGTQIPDQDGDEEDSYDESLYLQDGPLRDDILYGILSELKDDVDCVVLLDCCFSGTATRDPFLARMVRLFDIPPSTPPRRRYIRRDPNTKWVTISGAAEYQTAADAYFEGRNIGAFTYFLLKAYKEGMTIKEWYNKLRTYLPGAGLTQIPTLEGNKKLFNKTIL